LTKLNLFSKPTPKESSNKEKKVDLAAILKVATYMEESNTQLCDLFCNRSRMDYWYDSEEGELSFKVEDKVIAHSKVQLIGTFGKKLKRWMWAWAHDKEADWQLDTVCKVKLMGEKLGWNNFTDPVLYGFNEKYAWKLTCYASWMMDAAGVYQIDFGPCWWYMVLEEIIMEEEEEYNTDSQIVINSSEPVAE
jgi:hypothetical protein